MTQLSYTKVDKATFYDLVARHDDQRFEYEGGYIVQQMTGGTQAHSRIMGQLYRAIDAQLEHGQWVAMPERGVETELSIRSPDVVVEPANEADDTLTTTEPALVCEILSPSSVARELTRKPAEYMSLGSPLADVVVSQSEPVVLVWRRGSDGEFPNEPEQIEGLDNELTVPKLGMPISLGEIYRGIKLPPKDH